MDTSGECFVSESESAESKSNSLAGFVLTVTKLTPQAVQTHSLYNEIPPCWHLRVTGYGPTISNQ